ncbi:MAG TPA: hypothetical protein VMZ53_11145 [Kofleriaceae bacterium]|nr:hypothetical protein [Kofleriaceae bacterium]
MRQLVVGCMLCCAGLAHADDDVHDVFGFNKKPKQAPLDCSDGTAFGCSDASDPLSEREQPYALTTWLPATYLLSLPVADSTHDQVASYGLGASRDETGASFAGATGLENRWTVEGAPADGVRTGAADTRIPLAFLEGIRITAGGFTARDRASTGGTIDAELRRGTKTHEVEARAYLGWEAEARRRPIGPASYFTRRGVQDNGPSLSTSLVATGPLGALLGGSGWYAVGVAPEVDSTKFTFRSSTLTDMDGDGIPDGLPGVVNTQPVDKLEQTPITYRVPFMLRGGLDRGVHHLDVSLVGTASSDARFLFNSTLQAAGVNGRTIAGDAIATWRGTWKTTRARAQIAWHRTMRHEYARDPAAEDKPQLLSAYIPTTLDEDPFLAGACNDDIGSDRWPTITNCPVPFGWFSSGGAGPMADVTGDRPSITADIAHKSGDHVVRAGVTGEDTRLVTASRFSGGAQVRSLFDGHTSTRRFVDQDAACSTDLALPCPTVDTSVLNWRTRYTAAYLEDTWHADPKVKFDGGMRWELMWVGTSLHFSHELAPRFGVSWDPLGGGRSRIWTSIGRSYALLPAGLGSTILSRDRTVDLAQSPFGQSRSVDQGAVYPVVANVKPLAQDEATIGAQVALANAVRATTWLQGRWLREGLDTTQSGFDNPGHIAGAPAVRETGVFAFELATAPTAKLVLRAGYMYGRTIGNWTGSYDPRQGITLYSGDDFDATSQGLLGRLPTDMGHRTYIEAQRSAQVGRVKLSVATRLTTASGKPRSIVADSDDGIIYLLPRGSAGRGPIVHQANVRVAATWHDLDITLDLFNLFDRHTATNVEELYTTGTLHPIDHGTQADLPFLKTESGAEARRNPNAGVATGFQAPFSAFLGVRRAF